ncbi:MAG: tyrosine-type recombinase/integrase [Methylococcales bacterium]|jgi:site-specific recombinase XerD|nr:tyrosine-type recombinase/integrase [Methylococcales bacterium]MBT7445808.1 tyrosine-type recombinase/integrase [Methylococcales bacterium]
MNDHSDYHALSVQAQVKVNESDDIVKKLIQQGTPQNSIRALVSDLRYFWHWCAIVFPDIQDYPVPYPVIQTFVTDHLGFETTSGVTVGMNEHTEDLMLSQGAPVTRKGFKFKPGHHKLNTIKRRLSSLSKAHTVAGFKDHDVYHPVIKEMLKRARGHSINKPTKKDAMTKDVFEQLIAVCASNSLQDLRDRALIGAALVSGGRRRSEIVAMQFNDLKPRVINDAIAFEWHIHASKTHTVSDDALVVPILGEVAEWLDTWIFQSGIQEGHIFRSINRWEQIKKPLSAAGVRQIIKRIQEKAGLQSLDLSAHSIRSGFCTESARQGISPQESMALSNHKDVKTFFSYYRHGQATQNPAAKLFNTKN